MNNNAGYSKISSAHKSRSIDFSSAANNGGGEKFGVILGRTGSVSSSGGFLKKAFSMRRSSSVSERYCRIHDHHYVAITSPESDVPVRAKKKHSSGREGSKIFKACKRLLGL
ncbi:hypothetical protein HN51_064817 [Arachis hypogaea]|uniref:Uncharacterized protein n=1 Tax=Arachis hypogaea TaxID=3818 RepID=A0A444ZC35_ARAHY|nr:uncharacterized protein LOC107637518 [Arachis ipaensis]RYR11750.1 hypothetical protein Ahy_B04g069268 [Arachis hypogaea]